MLKPNLDERQLQKRNKIGNQTLFIVAYLLLADMGLHGYGIHWLDYPFNNYFIFLIGMGSYLVRIMWQGSYIGPGTSTVKNSKQVVLASILSVVVAACIIIIFLYNPSNKSESDSSNILIIASVVGFVILSITFVIRRNNNRDED